MSVSSGGVELPLRAAVVLHVTEDSCGVILDGLEITAVFAPIFPHPRVERVSPGHAVALAETPRHSWIVVWRWYDAVVIGDATGTDPNSETNTDPTAGDGSVRLWEPAHGEVLAARRSSYTAQRPGSRAYASSGLPGADWWVCGATPEVLDLAEVREFYDEHHLWSQVVEP